MPTLYIVSTAKSGRVNYSINHLCVGSDICIILYLQVVPLIIYVGAVTSVLYLQVVPLIINVEAVTSVLYFTYRLCRWSSMCGQWHLYYTLLTGCAADHLCWGGDICVILTGCAADHLCWGSDICVILTGWAADHLCWGGDICVILTGCATDHLCWGGDICVILLRHHASICQEVGFPHATYSGYNWYWICQSGSQYLPQCG